MVFKNFRIQILIRISLLVLSITLLVYSFTSQYVIIPVSLACTVIFQIFNLIKFVDKTNRDLAGFLESIRHSEFTRTFRSEGLGGSFENVSNAFNAVINDFKQVRAEKEEQYHFLQSIIQSVNVSIIAYSADGSIEMINKATRKLFQIVNLRNIKELEALSPELVNVLIEVKPGKSYLVKVQDEDDILQLSVTAMEVIIKDRHIVIATISNIQNVLEEQETEAWQKLISVLTHEIMNSITPIASLSSTLETMLAQENSDDSQQSHLSTETVDEIKQALQTITKRSNGLLHFVNTYRNLTRIPKPDFKITRVSVLLENIRLLMEEEVHRNGIECTVSVEPDNLEVYADERLIEQVIINLIKNSIHALEGYATPQIRIRSFQNKRGRVTIQVIDNGQGIIKEVLDKIFIPFFTTKPNGSGIGLSLSKQILRLHNGSITAQSTPEVETIFTLTF
jgi:two-component system nitrogen regulation sensor histidine kinase NtrY